MRTGPKPLSMHMSFAALKSMQQNLDVQAGDEDLKAFIRGVQKYQKIDYKVCSPSTRSIWCSGTVSLLALEEQDYNGEEIVVLIPSLINGSSIFNLSDDCSFMFYLRGEGFYPVLLDWGDVADDGGQQSMDGLVRQRLAKALQFCAGHFERPIHVLGYCLGGVLLVPAAIQVADVLKTVSFLATPFDFNAGEARLAKTIEFWAWKMSTAIQDGESVSGDWIHNMLSSMNPSSVMQKYIKFADMADESDERHFVAVEDWLNDGIDLPSEFVQSCIQDLFLANKMAAGKWKIDGRLVAFHGLDMPSMIVASKKDKLIEYDCAAGLFEALKNAELYSPDCGHIGMMVGGDERKKLWKKFSNFLKDHS